MNVAADRTALLHETLTRYWGYTSFRPWQREAIDAVLEDRDSVVVLPTGGGKSICFQVPALVRDGLALVVSPLISLMKDQVDTLVGNGVAAACYNSALAAGEKSAVVQGLREGRYRLLYVSPERLVGEGHEWFTGVLAASRVSFIAIDEAHCISQWGHDFRPEYRQLARLRDLLPGVGIHAFTATATSRVRHDIAAQLGLRGPLHLVGSFDRPNLTYRVLARSGLKQQLAAVLARHRGESGIIYCTSRKEVDALAGWLTTEGVRAVPYHAGLDDGDAAPQSGCVSQRGGRCRRGDRSLRDGHRSIGRSLRRACRSAPIARALPAGIGSRRPRRARRGMRADLLGRRFSQVAADARVVEGADRCHTDNAP